MNLRGWMLLAALSPCLAVAAGAPAPRAADAASADDQGTLCKREKVIGSNMAKRVCTTAAERQAARDKAQKDVHHLGSCASNDPGTCIGEF